METIDEAVFEKGARPNDRKLQIVVKIGSYFSKPEGGPKQYCKRECLQPRLVDKDQYSLLQLVNDIAKHRLWGIKQYLTLWRAVDDACIEIKSDENLLDWFEQNLEKGEVCIDAQVNDFEGAKQFSPTKRRCHPMVRNTLTQPLAIVPMTSKHQWPRFRKAYAGVFNSMTSKHQWSRVDLGYKIKKPKLRRKPGRPRVSRIKVSDEAATSKKRKCSECLGLGHTAKYCQGGPTASQRRRIASLDGTNDPSGASTSNAHGSERGRGRGRGRGGGRGRGRGRRGSGGLASWFEPSV